MRKKKLLSLIAVLPFLFSCSEISSSSSRFIPPSETSSSSDSSSSSGSSSTSSAAESIRAKAEEIIAAQDSISAYYEDYTISGTTFTDGTLDEVTYILSSKNDFRANKNKNGNELYVLTINEAKTVIRKDTDGVVTYSTDQVSILVAEASFSAIDIVRNTSMEIFKSAFEDGTSITIDAASIENDELSISLGNTPYLSNFKADMDYVFLANGLLKSILVKFTTGSYAGDYYSYSFSYGNSDLSYPEETPTSSSSSSQ